MENGYDENLTENEFFKTLQTEYEAIFRKAIYDNWTICVPCSESLNNYDLNEQNIFSHLLVPTDELPETHFLSLNQQEVRIFDNLVRLHGAENVPILFTEVFYADEVRYKILCIERPLNFCVDCRKTNARIYSVKTLKECIELLTLESTNESAVKKMDDIINQFLFLSSKDYFSKTVDQQIAFAKSIYNRCIQILLQDKKIGANVKASRLFMDNVRIAGESYMLHNIYSIVMKGLISNMTADIGSFNKALRNLANIQLKDLKVTNSKLECISKARNELSHFNAYTTVLGKLSCLKRCINLISSKSSSKLSVDELLPILVFLVVKSGISTWVAQLHYVKEFNFSQQDQNQANESSFLATTLEAVLTFIRSGLFFKSIYANDGDAKSTKSEDRRRNSRAYFCAKSKLFWRTVNPLLLNAFRCIYEDDMNELASVFEGQPEEVTTSAADTQYCHPLCSCDRCEKLHASSSQKPSLNVNSANDSGCSPLHVAACCGAPAIVNWLLNHGANPNCVDFSGSTPLHCAAAHGYQNTVLLLMYAHAHLHLKDDDGNQPLHLAASNGHIDCVKALLYFAEHAGIRLNVNDANKDGDTSLHLAVRYYYEDVTAILLNYNANPSLKNKHGCSVFELTESLAIRTLLNERYPSVVDLMTAVTLKTFSASASDADHVLVVPRRLSNDEYGVRPHTVETVKNADTLFKAVQENDTKLIKRLLGFGEGNAIRGVEGSGSPATGDKCHPLCRCEKCVEEAVVPLDEEFLDDFRKVDALSVNVCNEDGITALHVACKYGHAEAIQFMLDVGAKINARTYKQQLTPLHVACMSNQPSAVKILLDCGSCKINLCDRSGNTALHYACISGNVRIVELLRKYEPDVEIRNHKGKTAINESEENLSYTIMRMLKTPKSVVSEELLM